MALIYPYGYQEWKAHSIRNIGSEAVSNLKAMNNGLQQQLHLSQPKLSLDIEVICIPYILLTVVLCVTLEPNSKLSDNFVWLDMGLPNTEMELNTLNASVFTKFESLLSGYLPSFALNSAQFSG